MFGPACRTGEPDEPHSPIRLANRVDLPWGSDHCRTLRSGGLPHQTRQVHPRQRCRLGARRQHPPDCRGARRLAGPAGRRREPSIGRRHRRARGPQDQRAGWLHVELRAHRQHECGTEPVRTAPLRHAAGLHPHQHLLPWGPGSGHAPCGRREQPGRSDCVGPATARRAALQLAGKRHPDAAVHGAVQPRTRDGPSSTFPTKGVAPIWRS